MPNAMLCGKAVVEMYLGKVNGMRVKDIEDELVKNGDVPKSYLISESRMRRCRELPSVEVQDRNGWSEYRNIKTER